MQIDLTKVVRDEVGKSIQKALAQEMPKMLAAIQAEAIKALHLQVEREPPLDEEESWDILMMYPCVEFPYVTKSFLLSLLQDQGLIHSSDLERFFLKWRKEGRLELAGDRVTFDMEYNSLSAEAKGIGTSEVPEIGRESLSHQGKILNFLRDHSCPMSSQQIHKTLYPSLEKKAFNVFLKDLEDKCLVTLERRLGLSSLVTLNEKES